MRNSYRHSRPNPFWFWFWNWQRSLVPSFGRAAPRMTRLIRTLALHVPPTPSSSMLVEHRALEFAIDRWLNEGGSDVRSPSDYEPHSIWTT